MTTYEFVKELQRTLANEALRDPYDKLAEIQTLVDGYDNHMADGAEEVIATDQPYGNSTDIWDPDVPF